MNTTSVNNNLKSFVEEVIEQHVPLKITRRRGYDFVVISAEDWEREQETLYVLQNKGLMQQIAESWRTHSNNQGYSPTRKEMNEI